MTPLFWPALFLAIDFCIAVFSAFKARLAADGRNGPGLVFHGFLAILFTVLAASELRELRSLL